MNKASEIWEIESPDIVAGIFHEFSSNLLPTLWNGYVYYYFYYCSVIVIIDIIIIIQMIKLRLEEAK